MNAALTLTTVADRQAELTALYNERRPQPQAKPQPLPVARMPIDLADSELLNIAMNAQNGREFASLWRGDWTGYPSQSEADLALCSMLAFYTGNDLPRIDSLFRQSGLWREKWDEKRGTLTYGEMTLTKCYSSKVYTAKKAHQVENVPAQVATEEMTPEQMKARIAELEQKNALQTEVIRGVRAHAENKWEKETTRLVSIEMLLISYDRVERDLQQSLYDTFPVVISSGVNAKGERYEGLAGILNINRKTVGEACSALDQADIIRRCERYEGLIEEGQDTEKTHFDYAIQPAFLDRACQIADKTVRKPREAKKDIENTVDVTHACLECESPNLDITCRDCGTQTRLGELHACPVVEDTPDVPTQEPESDPCVNFTHYEEVCSQECVNFTHAPDVQSENESTPEPDTSLCATPGCGHLYDVYYPSGPGGQFLCDGCCEKVKQGPVQQSLLEVA